jgi:hypothetical protein
MTLALPACVGCLSAVAAYIRRIRRPLSSRGKAVLPVLADAWAGVAIERERCTTLIAVMAQLLPRVCVVERDAAGRERFIGPVATAPLRRCPELGW